MKKKIRWGVIGSAGIARRRTIPEGFLHADNAVLTAVYDINTSANRDVARQFGVHAAESAEALLGSEIEAVYVATPAAAHYENVCSAAAAGKHILCEKPLALTVGQAEKMAETCRRAGVQLGTAMMMRFSAQHQYALRMIQNGDLGQMVYARAQLSCWYPPIAGAWRQNPSLGGGGALIDMGGHCIDLLEMFMGRAVKVSCFLSRRIHSYPVEDSAVAMLYFENGSIGEVDTFFCIPDQSSKNALELYGDKGSIIACGTIGQSEQGRMTAWLDCAQAGYDAEQHRAERQGLAICPPPVNMYRAEVEEFSRALIENRPPSVGVEIGLRSQKILAACYESAAAGRAVEIR